MDLREFISICNEYWLIKTENYIQENIVEIIFSYKIIEELSKKQIHIPESNKVKPLNLVIGNYKIPQTMDLYQWGDVQFILNYSEAIVYKFKSKAQYNVTFDKYTQKVKYNLEGKTLLEFTDVLTDVNNLGSFTRFINNQKINFVDGKIDFKERTYKLNKIKKESPKPFLNNRFVTMDLETYNKDGILTPYAICYYDGKKEKSFYLTDYKDSKDMLTSCIKSLLTRKYNNYRIYLHNFSNFDGIFLFNVLSMLSDNLYPIINDGKLVDWKLTFAQDKYKIFFRIINASLIVK